MTTRERVTVFLTKMLKTIKEYMDEKKYTYKVNDLYIKLTKDIIEFVSHIYKNSNIIDNCILQIDMKDSDSFQEKLLEYRYFLKNISPDKKYAMYQKNIIHHINNFLLL